MKKFTLSIFIIISFTLLFASPVNYSQAQNVALSHLELHSMSNHQISDSAPILNNSAETIAWVFNLAPAGFVIVTSDTDLVPVYGYSFRNQFSLLESNRNSGLHLLREDIRLRHNAHSLIEPQIITQNNQKWQAYLDHDLASLATRDRSVFPPSSYNTPTGGWIVTQWDQGYPFNQYCPIDPDAGGRSVVGCVATSFAQVVNYHREIGSLSFSDDDDYVSSNYTSPVAIDDDWETYNFLNFSDLNLHMDDLRDNYANGEYFTNELKGALSFACGVLTEMQYSNGGSGTQTLYAGYAFSQRLGYDSVTNIYTIGNDFYDILSDDMVNGRPVMMSILGGPEGHCIIADGWNSDSDYYHLNMGWSGFDDGWYSLPQGMPSGYSVIAEAVCNIEGGTVPVDVLGFVNTGGIDATGTVINLEGTVDYLVETDENGMFDIAFVHEGQYTLTATLALPQGGYYYHQQEEYISSSNTFLEISLDNYEFITGNISAPVDPTDTEINIFSGDEIVSQAQVDANGNYQAPGLLPGSYVMVASLAPNYGRVRHINVSLEEQSFDFELFDYQQNTEISYASEPTAVWSLIATTMSVAIKLTEEELADMEQALISEVSFIAPIAPDEGMLWAQVWQNETLVSESLIQDFAYGEEVNTCLDNFAMVDASSNYYVGYKIQSSNADIAWHDQGPRIPGKGAWFRINAWTELPITTDANFCIKAKILHPMLPDDQDNIYFATKHLNQNYPNPFNPVTNISFQLPEAQMASLNIYNLKGELVKQLNTGILDAGYHSFTWNGTDKNNLPAASGIYFYQLKTKNISESRKMILLK